MSRDWEQNLTGIVRETESNIARFRQRLDGSRYNKSMSLNSGSPLGSFNTMSQSLPRSYATSPSLQWNSQNGSADWRPAHRSYRYPAGHTAPSLDAVHRPSSPSAIESPGVIAILTDKLDSQDKTIQSLTRQVELLQRGEDRTATHLRRLDQELSAVGQRLHGGGVHSETEQRMEGWKHDVALRLDDLRGQVAAHARSAADGSYSNDVLNTLTMEVHDFKRLVQQDIAGCRRDLDSLNTKLTRLEVDRTNQHVDGKDLSRRMDHLDRTLTSLSDSQRSQTRGRDHTLTSRQNKDYQILQLRAEMTRLMNTVEQIEKDIAHTSTNGFMSQGRHVAPQLRAPQLRAPPLHAPQHRHQRTAQPQKSSGPGKPMRTKQETAGPKYKSTALRVSKAQGPMLVELTSDSDVDLYTESLTPASSDSDDDSSSDLPPLRNAKHTQRSTYQQPYKHDEEYSDAISDLTSALVECDPGLDLVELASTPSISSLESDPDLL